MTRWALLVRELRGLLSEAYPPHRTQPYPRLRSFILDVMAEGRRKNIINLLMDVNASCIKEQLRSRAERTGQHLSITCYLAHTLACSVADHPQMQAYRKGAGTLVLFDDVDLSVMVERDIGEALMPVTCIVRAANRTGLTLLQDALQSAKSCPLGQDGPMSALQMFFFKAPRGLRRIIWWWTRRDPHLFKQLVGTVGITSMGMYATGAAVVQPITPMTLTLSIGSISTRCERRAEELIETEILHLNFSADHDIIDGAPLMRFADEFRRRLEAGTDLTD